jgi:hypothetical protein
MHLGRTAVNLLGSSIASLAAKCQTFPASKSENPMRSTALSFVSTGFPVSPSLELSGRIIEVTASESSPSFEHPFSFLQTLFQGGGAARRLSVSCSSADIFASSSPLIGHEDGENIK